LRAPTRSGGAGRRGPKLPLKLPRFRRLLQIEPAPEVAARIPVGQFDRAFVGQAEDEVTDLLAGAEFPSDQFVFTSLGKVVDGKFKQHAADPASFDVAPIGESSILQGDANRVSNELDAFGLA